MVLLIFYIFYFYERYIWGSVLWLMKHIFKKILIILGMKKCLKCVQRKIYCVVYPNATTKRLGGI